MLLQRTLRKVGLTYQLSCWTSCLTHTFITVDDNEDVDIEMWFTERALTAGYY